MRYYNSWFEELNEEEQKEEDEYREEYLKAIKDKHEKAVKRRGLVGTVSRQKFRFGNSREISIAKSIMTIEQPLAINEAIEEDNSEVMVSDIYQDKAVQKKKSKSIVKSKKTKTSSN